MTLSGKNVLLGVCGGVAAYKAALLARELVKRGARVVPCLTAAAERFVGPLTFEALCGCRCLRDSDLFGHGDAIAHVQAAKECDLIVIAPATANTMAKVACGIADNMLTAVVLASCVPLLLVPAMHEGMWENAATQENVATLRRRGFIVLEPEVGELASGDVGIGRFPETAVIVEQIEYMLARHDFEGFRVVVTAGPTREHLDPVRVLTNPSSGRMGIALARAAARRGAAVCLVLGPTLVPAPRGPRSNPIEVVRVESTAEMYEAVRERMGGAHALLMAAAPADQRPARPFEGKVRKEQLPENLELVRTVDILASLPRPEGLVTLGFAAETGDVEESGRRKLEQKRLDFLFANPVGQGLGFGSLENQGVLLWQGGKQVFPPMPKERLADILLDFVRLRLR